MTRNIYTRRDRIVSEFLHNPREGIRYANGRMYVRQNPDGDGYQLVAYGNEILAEIEGDEVTFYTGHHGQVSQTVTNYIKRFGSVLSRTEGFDADIRGEAPTNGYVARHINSASAQFISNYVGSFDSEMSSVEKDAMETVEETLDKILALEFGE